MMSLRGCVVLAGGAISGALALSRQGAEGIGASER